MKLQVALFVLFFATTATATAVVTTVGGETGTQASEGAIGHLLAAGSQAVTQSVLVVRLSDGKTLYEKNPDQLVTPASVTKVVTSAAVLTRLTPAYTFKTPFYYTGERKNDRVLGDLVVVGAGDPFIVSEKLWQLAADLKNQGIREFTGDLVIDDALFDGESRDEARIEGAKASVNAYDAPVSAFGVNFNTFAVLVAPGDRPGRPAFVSLDPYPLRGVILTNDVRTGKPHLGKALEVRRTVDVKGGEHLVATGTIAADMPMQKIYRSVADDVQASGATLKAFLKGAGVIVRGHIHRGRLPKDATLLYTLDSYPMRKIVAGLNTYSNNYIADMLVKRLGAAYPPKGLADAPGSGSFANGVRVLTDFLHKDVGIKSAFVLKNGSGLATENRLSARQVVAVLAYMEKHMEAFPEFLGSLPATGWSGTLRHRFDHGAAEEMKGLFRAKTGTLTEPIAVSAIAGYFRHPKHGLVAFTILENGVEGKRQPAIADLRDQQDRVLAAFMKEI